MKINVLWVDKGDELSQTIVSPLVQYSGKWSQYRALSSKVDFVYLECLSFNHLQNDDKISY